MILKEADNCSEDVAELERLLPPLAGLCREPSRGIDVNQQQPKELRMRLFELEDRPVAWFDFNDGRVFNSGVWSGPLVALGRKAPLSGTELSVEEFSKEFPEAAKSLSTVLYAVSRQTAEAASSSR
jgi:hypothetical protein